MKKSLLLFLAIGLFLSAQSQIDIEGKLKRKVEQRANQKVDQAIDKTLDKTEEGVKDAANGKNKKSNKSSSSKTNKANDDADDSDTESASSTGKAPVKSEKISLKAYSKFDFVAGEKVIGYEDFSQDAVGDFPDKWNTNASGEIVTFDGVEGKWLQMDKNGVYFPEYIGVLPENVTIEFDIITSEDWSPNYGGLAALLIQEDSRNLQYNTAYDTQTKVSVDFHPYNNVQGSSNALVYDKDKNRIINNSAEMNSWKLNEVNHISIWKQKSRLRVYINESKVWDLPKAIDNSVAYKLMFTTYLWSGNAYIGNLKVAIGAPDTRNKLITEGKLVTRGITFDVNSDKIKPESHGMLKEIANTLKEASDIRVKIIGHTDSDGSDDANLALSKKRAESVKNALVSEFGIDSKRLETDGKGEAEPVDSNSTPEGKANNRRVEFVKL